MNDIKVFIYIKKECVEVSKKPIEHNKCIIGIERHISKLDLVFDGNIGILDEVVRQTMHLAIFDLIRSEGTSIVSVPYISK